MPAKLTTTIRKIYSVPNPENSAVIEEFYQYMRDNGSSVHHQNNNLKAIIAFANFLGSNITFDNMQKKEQILAFLDGKIKTEDLEKRMSVKDKIYSFNSQNTCSLRSN
jgi:integrase/recombinase XerD